MDPEHIMNGLMTELNSAVKSLAKAKSVEDKVQYSTIVKNLSESLGVFLDAANSMMMHDYDEDEEED